MRRWIVYVISALGGTGLLMYGAYQIVRVPIGWRWLVLLIWLVAWFSWGVRLLLWAEGLDPKLRELRHERRR